MLKRVEILCSLKRVRGFAPYGWANVRQRHLTCVGFGKGHSSSTVSALFSEAV